MRSLILYILVFLILQINEKTIQLFYKDKIVYFRSMNFIRKILFPLSILYSAIASIRNYCYDKGLLKSYAFNLPIIVVGNISVGGTGKTPQIEYLIRLLSEKYKTGRMNYVKAFFIGLWSNIKAQSDLEYSSHIYVFKNW